MEVVICATPDEVARVAAAKVARVLRDAGPRAVLGVATGSSPLALYAELAALAASGRLALGEVSAFALDEYVGLPYEHPESYHSVIDRTVTRPLGLDPARVHVPNGMAADIAAAASDYEAAIKTAGGVDVQILGVGSNGHIGFNEPTSSLASRTRIKTLAPKTREDNARFFDSPGELPMHCITQGIGTILDANRLLLVAQGAGKAEAVAAMIEGPVTSMCPASALQLHPDAIAVIDRAAASALALIDYYEYVERNRPREATSA